MFEDFKKMSNLLITPSELSALQKSGAKFTLIDARFEESYKNGHIPSAVNVGNTFLLYFKEDSSEETMKQLQGSSINYKDFSGALGSVGVKREDKIVVYEDSMNMKDGCACRAYFLLTYLGVEDVKVLKGGFDAWKKAGLPEAKEIPAPQASTFTPKINSDLLADRKLVESAIKEKSHTLIDCRDEVEWSGKSSSPIGEDYCPRKDDPNPMTDFKDPQVVRDVCMKAGVKSLDSPVIIYCFIGARASNVLMAMKAAGFKNVKNYLASWNEWSRIPELPIDATEIKA